jgi:hypothetical protein
MSRRIFEILDEATNNAAVEAKTTHASAIQQIRRDHAEKQKIHHSKVTALQKQLDVEIAERARLEASVADMLEETAAQCKAESVESLEAMKKRHAHEVSALEREHSRKCRRLSGEVASAQAERDIAQAATARAHKEAQETISATEAAAAAEVERREQVMSDAIEEAYRS